MNDQEQKTKQNANDHLANERTLLAWIRTGIGIMVFGFVVVKFALFTKAGEVLGQTQDIQHQSYSGPVGVILVALGSLSLLLATLRYSKTKKQIETNQYAHNANSIYLLVSFIMAVSMVLIYFLLKTM